MKPLRHLLLPLLLLAAGCHTTPKVASDLLDVRENRDAAQRGDAAAQFNLGAAYASHWQLGEASFWFRKAADQGLPAAEFRLAENYSTGAGVPESIIEAYAWYNVAAVQGSLPAINARQTLATKMTRAETESGIRRAAALLATIPPENLRYRNSLDLSAQQFASANKSRNTAYVPPHAATSDFKPTYTAVPPPSKPIFSTTPSQSAVAAPTPVAQPKAPVFMPLPDDGKGY